MSRVAARLGKKAGAGYRGGQRKAGVAGVGARARHGTKQGQWKGGGLWLPC